jgi:DNA-binding beta-propeller fold protein YncE
MREGHGRLRGGSRASSVAAVLVALLLPASAAAFEPLAAMGGGGGLVLPLGVAVDGAGGVYASEHLGQRVSRFTTAGVFAWAWGFDVGPGRGEGFEVCTPATGCKPGSPGGRAGQLGFPGGIAASRGGDVYVSDPANDRISRFTAGGAFVSAFGFDVVAGGGRGLEVCSGVTGCKRGIAGARAGQLNRPAYIASDGAGSIYVTDEGNNRVNQFTTDGAFVRALGFDVRPGGGTGLEVCTSATRCRRGRPGGGAGQLTNPDGVGIDAAGNLYVADANSRVSTFTREGAFVRAFGFDVRPGGGKGFEVCTRATGCKRGRAGAGAGQLSSLLGIATDTAGNVYVADSGNGRVSQFTTDGAFVRAFGLDVVPGGGKEFEVCTRATRCKRVRPGAFGFLTPSAVAVDPSGSIYVSDVQAGRILCLGEPGSSPCVRNLIGFGTLERDRRRGTARLAGRVPGPGSLALEGRQIKPVRTRPAAAGTVRLPIRPRRGTRRRLNREGKARVQLSVTYTPTNGGPNTTLKRIELRKVP